MATKKTLKTSIVVQSSGREITDKEIIASVNKAKEAYQSETAEQLYAAFEKIKAQFPDFLDCVNNCSRYLSETVAPAYQRLENEAASKVA